MGSKRSAEIESATVGCGAMVGHALASDMGFIVIVYDNRVDAAERAQLATSLEDPRACVEILRCIADTIEGRLVAPS